MFLSDYSEVLVKYLNLIDTIPFKMIESSHNKS